MKDYPLRLTSFRRVSWKPWARYKYELTADHWEQTQLTGFHKKLYGKDGKLYAELFTDGRLWIAAGYQWDGCSGPTWDTASTFRGGLAHDVLYQMMREGLLPVVVRPLVDDRFHEILLEDGTWPFRAWYYYKAVETFAERYARPKLQPPIVT